MATILGEQRCSVVTLGLSGGDDLGVCAKHGYIIAEGILLHFTVPVVHEDLLWHNLRVRVMPYPMWIEEHEKVLISG